MIFSHANIWLFWIFFIFLFSWLLESKVRAMAHHPDSIPVHDNHDECIDHETGQWHVSIIFRVYSMDKEGLYRFSNRQAIFAVTPRGETWLSLAEALEFVHRFIILIDKVPLDAISSSPGFIADDGSTTTPPDPPPPGGSQAEQVFPGQQIELYCLDQLDQLKEDSLCQELETKLGLPIANLRHSNANHLVVIVQTNY